MSYNKIQAKLSQSQINKLKKALKNKSSMTLRLSMKNFGTSTESYPHELLLTNRQIKKLEKAQNPINIDFSHKQIQTMSQSGGFLGSLLKFAMPLVKNVLAPLGLSAAMSATDAAIQKKVMGGGALTMTMSKSDMDDIKDIVKELEKNNIVNKGTTKQLETSMKKQEGGFLGMLLGTLGASLLGNLLSGGIKGKGMGWSRAGQGWSRAGQDF